MGEIKSLNDVKSIRIDSDRQFYSANHDEILNGLTTEYIY